MRRLAVLLLLCLGACTAQRAARVAAISWCSSRNGPPRSTTAPRRRSPARRNGRNAPGRGRHVIGFADPAGSQKANIDLSRTRAQVVVDQLTRDGVEPGRIRLDGARLDRLHPDLAGEPAGGDRCRGPLSRRAGRNLAAGPGGDAAPRVRLPRLPGPAGAGGAPRRRRRRRAGADADRRRQEHLLPGSGAVPARHRGGRLAADRADGRPGGGAAPARRGGGRAAFRSRPGRGARASSRDLVEEQLDLLYVSPERLLAQRHARAAVAPAARAVRDRRGALRLAMGPRVPPGIPRAGLPAGAVPRRAARRADRDRRSAHARRHSRSRCAMDDAEVFAASFHRANLHLAAAPKVGETAQLLDLLRAPRGRVRHRLLRQPRQDRARSPRGCSRRAFPRSLSTPGWSRATSARRWRGSAPASRWSWSRRSPSAWASTGPTCASSCISTCRTARRPTTSRSAAPDATATRRETLLLYGGEDIARARHWLAQSAAPEAQKRVMRDAAGGDDRAHRDAPPAAPGRCSAASARSWRDRAAIATTARAAATCSTRRSRRRRCSRPCIAPSRCSARCTSSPCCAARRPRWCCATATTGCRRSASAPTSRAAFWRGRDPPAHRARALLRHRERRVREPVPGAGQGAADPARRRARDAARGGRRPRRRGCGRSVATRRRRPTLPAGADRCSRRCAPGARREAKAQAIPPYVIFHDTVLREIAAVRPGEHRGAGPDQGRRRLEARTAMAPRCSTSWHAKRSR